MERLAILNIGRLITLDDIPRHIRGHYSQDDKDVTLPEMIQKLEINVIRNALAKHGSTRKAAESIGITQTSLMRRIEKYDIETG
jgi:transcriptional regulator with PAS, ATPase and Fis domain